MRQQYFWRMSVHLASNSIERNVPVQHDGDGVVKHGLAEDVRIYITVDAECLEHSQNGDRIRGGNERTVNEAVKDGHTEARPT